MSKSPSSKVKQLTVTYLTDNPFADKKEIAEALNISVKYVSTIIRMLKKDGLIRMSPNLQDMRRTWYTLV